MTKKEFREKLNKEYSNPMHRNGRYRQIKRPYGDYLYYQDRDKFNMLYETDKSQL